MFRILLILFLFSLILFNSLQTICQTLDNKIKRISVIVPEFQYEKKINDQSTILMGVGVNPNYLVENINGERTSSIGVSFFGKGHYRRYFGLQNREEKNKVTAHNSGFYGSLGVEGHIFGNTDDGSGALGRFICLQSGFQRALGKKGFFNFSGGMAYATYFFADSRESGIVPVVNFNLGFVLKSE